MDNIVYSTDPNWKPCPKCGASPCRCAPPVKLKQAEPVRLSFRRTGKGSGVTLIERLAMHPQGKEDLLKKLKKTFGVGGSVKNGVPELQGDLREKTAAQLQTLGYKVRILQ